MIDHTLLFVGMPGGMELMIILFIAVMLFGANKIPELARSSGQAMGEFKRGREELEQELKSTVKQGEREALENEGESEATSSD